MVRAPTNTRATVPAKPKRTSSNIRAKNLVPFTPTLCVKKTSPCSSWVAAAVAAATALAAILLLATAATMIGPHLHPSPSWWLEHLPPASDPAPLERLPKSADVVVIGSGMTGCAAAYWLDRLYGRQCLVVDARGVAGGATGRNGGHLWA